MAAVLWEPAALAQVTGLGEAQVDLRSVFGATAANYWGAEMRPGPRESRTSSRGDRDRSHRTIIQGNEKGARSARPFRITWSCEITRAKSASHGSQQVPGAFFLLRVFTKPSSTACVDA